MSITQQTIKELATKKSYDRGDEYYHYGAIMTPYQRGNLLLAEVEGSEYNFYQVSVTLTDDGDFLSADCSCPYDWGGECKHVVALLLTYLHKRDTIEQKSEVTDLLSGLDKTLLLTLLTDLLQKESHLIDWVETQIKANTQQQSVPRISKSTQVTPVDPTPFTRQTKSIFRRGHYYDVGYDIAHDLNNILDQVQPYLERAEVQNSLLLLLTITDSFIYDSWGEFMHEDEFSEVFERLTSMFTEALLMTEFSEAERFGWRDQLEKWQKQAGEYGYDEVWDMPIATAEDGWDDPLLADILADGYQPQAGEEPPFRGDATIPIRLQILERQGRTTEYLYLAEAADDTTSYVCMLAKMGRVEEAIDYKYLTHVDEVLALAKTLLELHQPGKAMKIGERGLSMHGDPVQLARWVRETAQKEEYRNLALQAAQVAFEGSFARDDYYAIRSLVGNSWDELKPQLLRKLIAGDKYSYDRIDIYLSEGLVDEAVAYIKQRGYGGFDDLRKVTEAAVETHPDWVIERCVQQAEEIMDAGRSKAYPHAIDWLKTAKTAYSHADKTAVWQTYLESLINKHGRKYSLRPSLEGLR
ncbi:hypothetical protein QUF63_09885 [Anaerolineales bacterium HSG25]|nr:hypothetical protein [Anaerolineales bacterium HSG25]